MERVGRRIREIRKKNGHTLTQLAQKLNIDKAHLSRMETNKVPINFDVIKRVASIYSVKHSYFVDDDFNESEQNLLNDIDLTNEEIIDKHNITIDGKQVSKEEIAIALATIRSLRTHIKKD